MTDRESLLMEQAFEKALKNKAIVEKDPYRLSYHLMPPVGFLNDPNGLIKYQGVYHVFYQWNPFAATHGAKFWGHYSSVDLVHWREEPIALAPSEWYEKDGCYSGSAIEAGDKLHLFYTGNVKHEDGTRGTYQCLALSTDGIYFEKKGPIVRLPDGYTTHFRDPKVWRKNDRWYMIVGAQTLAGEGRAVLFTSVDLTHWEELGAVAGSGMNGLGDFGYMWECPDLITLNDRDLLLVSPQGLEPDGHFYRNLYQSGYFVGQLDYETATFRHGAFTELDRGFDFYAPQTFTDESGRRILFAWMGMTDDSEPYQPTIANNWLHALTIPRELQLQNDKIYQKPVAELRKLRKKEVRMDHVALEGDQLSLNDMHSAELILDFAEPVVGGFEVHFRGEAFLTYDSGSKEVRLQRRNVRTNRMEERVCSIDSLTKLHIFLDHSSLEIFVNDGQEMFTARYFPDPAESGVILAGRAELGVKMWDLG